MKKTVFILSFLFLGTVFPTNAMSISNDCCALAEQFQDYLISIGVSRDTANECQVLFYDLCVQQ